MNNATEQKKIIGRLYRILQKAESNEVSVIQFCEDYERIYNLELEKKNLSRKENVAFKALFDKVVWFSPYPEDRKNISSYLDENEIMLAIKDTLRILNDNSAFEKFDR